MGTHHHLPVAFVVVFVVFVELAELAILVRLLASMLASILVPWCAVPCLSRYLPRQQFAVLAFPPSPRLGPTYFLGTSSAFVEQPWSAPLDPLPFGVPFDTSFVDHSCALVHYHPGT